MLLIVPNAIIRFCPGTKARPQVSALTASPHPGLAANLYTYLTQQAQYETPESRQNLIRRLREALVKNVSIVGVCKPIEAVFRISEVERQDRVGTINVFAAHKDFGA